jgi:REP element-mobilizing transposase RayT
MSEHLKAHKEGTLYFCTLTVVGWADVFTRARNADIIIKNLAVCQATKGLELFAYVLMPSHLHMIARVQEGRLSDVLRDFKSFTAKRLLEVIAKETGESRKEWLMRLFREAARESKQNQDLMFWQKSVHPIEITHPAMFEQKVEYIHNNPVKEGLVTLPEHYALSSAHPESPLIMFEHEV